MHRCRFQQFKLHRKPSRSSGPRLKLDTRTRSMPGTSRTRIKQGFEATQYPQDVCRFADMEQRHPTGMLSNIQGLLRSIYPGWPLFKNLDYNLQCRGPLPRVCPCSFVHKDPINDTGGSFLASSSFSLSLSFWSRLFRDVWCSGHITGWGARPETQFRRCSFLVVCHRILAAALHSLESGTVDESSFESTQLRRMWIGSCLLRLRSGPELSTRSLVASACTRSSSFPSFTSSPTLDTQHDVTPPTNLAPGYALAIGSASSSCSPILSTGTSSGSRSGTKGPLDSSSPRVGTPDGHGAPTVGLSTSRENLCLLGYPFSSF